MLLLNNLETDAGVSLNLVILRSSGAASPEKLVVLKFGNETDEGNYT